MSRASHDDLVDLRRDLHRHPEPAWCEFYTTARIVAALRERDLDALYVGPEVLAVDERMSVPDDDTLSTWRDRAREAGADPDVLSTLAGGTTGAVAVAERGDGPTVALRVDIDGLPIEEADGDGHAPAVEGFRSEHEGYMHACGHDAHATIGVGALDAVLDSGFEGTLKVVFQPAEERVAGGAPVAESGRLDDVDYLLATHVGLDHPTGEVVAGVDGFLAVSGFEAEFTGAPSHAGGHPEAGRNAVQAMAAAIQNMYAVPRHNDGPTRVNAGVVEGGTATNVVPERARIGGEVRGGTTELMEYMWDETGRAVEAAAAMHDCEVRRERISRAPSAESDQGLVDVVADAAADVDGVESLLERDTLGGSEDATYLMRRVQNNGGLAAYVGVGTDHPGGHHTATFDVDEASLSVGTDVLAGAVESLSDRPERVDG